MKRLLFQLGILSVFFMLIASACDFCKNVIPYWMPEQITMTAFTPTNIEIQDSTLVGLDTLKLSLSFDPVFLSKAESNWTDAFVPQAYALKCNPDGYMGMKSLISSFVLYSDEPFNAVNAGESLNHFLFNAEKDTLDLEYLNHELSGKNYPQFNFEGLILKTNGTPTLRTFKLDLYLSNGQSYSAISQAFIW